MKKFQEQEWVKYVQKGQLDEALRIYLTIFPFFEFTRHVSLRKLSIFLSGALIYYLNKTNRRFSSVDGDIDLDEEFLIFWKSPDCTGRFLLRKLLGTIITEKIIPVRGLVWLAHWLVFQGEYGKAVTLFRLSLLHTERNSRLHGEALSMVGNYFYSRGKYEASISFHQKSNALLVLNNDKFFEMFNLGTSAKVYAEIGDLENFNKHILSNYDHLNPVEPDERYGMRVLIYGSYLNLIDGNVELGKQFYITAEKCFAKSGSELDKAIYCMYKSVILLFFRDLHGARWAILEAKECLGRYGHYRTYARTIRGIEQYLDGKRTELRIIDNLLSKHGVTVRSELENWFYSYFTTILPVLEHFQDEAISSIQFPLEKATNSRVSISLLKESIDMNDVRDARFETDEVDNSSIKFNVDIFHSGKLYELCLTTLYKKWRNPEIYEAIRATLNLLQSISRQDQLKSIASAQAQRIKENEVGRRIAHDIKSPLAALQIAINSLGDEVQDLKIIKSSTQRIEDIANSLSRKRQNEYASKSTKILVKSFFDALIASKRFEYQGKNLDLRIRYLNSSAFKYINVNELELSRTMSNIVNNAYEAYTDGGPVDVVVDVLGAYLSVTVQDSGCGIERELLDKIIEKDFSLKAKGSGLGLYYAKQYLDSIHGELRISSLPKVGTSIIIDIPLTTSPGWIKDTLFLAGYDRVVIVDDFYPNTEMIKKTFLKKCPGLEIITFTTTDQLDLFLLSNADLKASTFFVIDYEFVNSTKTGVDLILGHGIKRNSILTTHHFENDDVIKLCSTSRIKICPKTVFTDIRIRPGKVDVYIADDEKYFLQALKSKIDDRFFNLHLFSDCESMLENLELSKDDPYFLLDHNFSENKMKGSSALDILFGFGKTNLYNISEDSSHHSNTAIKIKKSEVLSIFN